MPTAATAPAAKAFRKGGKGGIPLRTPPAIPQRRSVLTVRQRAVSTIPIISVPRGTWTLRDAEPATVGKRHAQPLKKGKKGPEKSNKKSRTSCSDGRPARDIFG